MKLELANNDDEFINEDNGQDDLNLSLELAATVFQMKKMGYTKTSALTVMSIAYDLVNEEKEETD